MAAACLCHSLAARAQSECANCQEEAEEVAESIETALQAVALTSFKLGMVSNV